MEPKRVLCYGDSNTWGFIPGSGERYPEGVRWTSVLSQELGSHYRIVEEGLNGRTTVWEDPIEEYRNGKTHLIPCLLSHRPLDLVILMLGTNDLKKRFCHPASDIAEGVELLARMVQKSASGPKNNAPQILLIAPPPISQKAGTAGKFEGGFQKSQDLAGFYEIQAKQNQCGFLNAADYVAVSPKDGIHWEGEDHIRFGKLLAQKVREYLAV